MPDKYHFLTLHLEKAIRELLEQAESVADAIDNGGAFDIADLRDKCKAVREAMED